MEKAGVRIFHGAFSNLSTLLYTVVSLFQIPPHQGRCGCQRGASRSPLGGAESCFEVSPRQDFSLYHTHKVSISDGTVAGGIPTMINRTRLSTAGQLHLYLSSFFHTNCSICVHMQQGEKSTTRFAACSPVVVNTYVRPYRTFLYPYHR